MQGSGGGASAAQSGASQQPAQSLGGKSMRSDSAFYVLRRTEDIGEKYELGDQLGHGQFGVVSVGVHRETGKRYAIKSVNKRRADAKRRESAASINGFVKDIRTEVEVLYHLGGHPNVVQLHEVYEDGDAIHLVLEMCQGGDWLERLLQRGLYTEAHAADTMRTLLEALLYCHSLGVVHRDLKPDNMLFTDDSDTAVIKLADFGLSAMVPQAALQAPDWHKTTSGDSWPLEDVQGTPYYLAPEMLDGEGYGKEVDIWSLGVVLYIVLCGFPPFNGKNQLEVFYQIMSAPLTFKDPTWDHISDSAKDFLRLALTKDPSQRASIPDLLAHPWLAERASNAGGQADAGAQAESSGRTSVPDTVLLRLNQFALMNRFKKEARKVLASMLPEEEIVGMLGIFKEMDADKNGVLSVSEVRSALERKGVALPQKQARIMMHYADMNTDGMIDYEEFLAFAVHQHRLDKDTLLFKAFRKFDTHGKGTLSRQEVEEALKHHGTKVDVDHIVSQIDVDGDGQIDYNEFCNCMRKQEQGKISFGASMKNLMNGIRLSPLIGTAPFQPQGIPTLPGPRPAGAADTSAALPQPRVPPPEADPRQVQQVMQQMFGSAVVEKKRVSTT